VIQTTITITMGVGDAAALVPDFDKPGGYDKLVAKLGDTMNIGGDTGGWAWKVTRTGEKPAEGTTDRRDLKLVGRFVAAGEHVIG
jgi:hypothetical protein